MPVNISEANLETIIERVLVTGTPDVVEGPAEPKPSYDTPFAPGGFLKRKPEHFDRSLCLDKKLLVKFIQATQPDVWKKYKKYHKDPNQALANGVAGLIAKRGSLHLFRKGYKESGCQFRLIYFRPNTTLNPELQKKYEGNLFSVIRQLRYRPETEASQPELDLTIFVNGIPVFTTELKNLFTNQNVFDAIRQYKETRSPKEHLFQQGRCLAHFAVDPNLIYFTTHLNGNKSRFFPFNKGYNRHAGNPPVHELSKKRFASSYLWYEVWSRDSVLNLISHFFRFYDELDEKGQKTGKKQLIFTRYHQLTSVRKLVADARLNGPGQRYLVQHSAGSGKTFTIAWLAYQLSTLHDDQDNPVFDSVLIISDRRVLDDQLQQTMRDFEQKRGVVENIDKTSRQLKKALEDGKRIIVTTLQKFPVIAHQIDELPGQRFAVIVDEAHSSQSGASVQQMNRALSVEDQETEEAPEDMEDVLVREMNLRRHLTNVSTFAFTATPKSKTLQLFGQKESDGTYRPFSLYPMRQAIEEGFIKDVLQNYTTYKSYYRLLKTVEDDPHYDKKKGIRLLRAFVDSHQQTIGQKVAIIVEHFNSQVAQCINGKAKAMIVTRSRPHAVMFKLAVDDYLQEHDFPYLSLVAFSGQVTDTDTGIKYTESGMNTLPTGEYISESKTVEVYKNPEYRFLIVANKFQTGFNQPLLHTMYVDKKMGGVNAVQTLSRLNRSHPDKGETLVLDFVNEAEEIQKAFEPYYEQTILSEGTDPNVLYELQNELEEFHFYNEDEVDAFISVYLKGRSDDLPKLYAILNPVIDRFEEASEDEQVDFRKRLNDFIRLYAFLSQILPFTETDWEKLFHFYRLLLTVLPINRERLPLEIQQEVDMQTFRLQQTFEGSIGLQKGDPLHPVGQGGSWGVIPEELEPLSVILDELNRLGGIKPTEDNKAAVRQLQTKLVDDPALEASVRVNPPDNARLTFDEVAQDLFEEMIEDNFQFYKQVTDEPVVKKRFFDWLFDQYLNDYEAAGETGL